MPATGFKTHDRSWQHRAPAAYRPPKHWHSTPSDINRSVHGHGPATIAPRTLDVTQDRMTDVRLWEMSEMSSGRNSQSVARAPTSQFMQSMRGRCFGLVWTILYFRWYAQHAAGRVVRTYAHPGAYLLGFQQDWEVLGEKTCSSGIPRSGIAKVLRLQTGRKIRTDSDPKGRAHV